MRNDNRPLRVAIVGAGIGGLTAAIALRARGVDARVYEQAPQLRALGAGVAIAPNGARILTRLGLADRLEAVAGPISHFVFRSWQGEPIAGEPSTLSFGNPAHMWFLHRGEFQRVLSDALPADAITLGRAAVGATEHGDGVTLRFGDGSTADADVLVAADGIHSRLQSAVTAPAEPVSEGIMAYRGLIPADRLTDVAPVGDMSASAMWMGPERSFLVYPVSAGRLLNVVAFTPTNLDVLESWTAPGDPAELAASYQGWDQPVLDIIGAMDETFRWGIYDREPLPRWSSERITLLGDSAHAVVPHLGQGANQAIEDAVTLAVLLDNCTPADVSTRLRLYQDLRSARTRRVREAARAVGRIYRSADSAALDRARRINALLDDLGVNTYDAERAAEDALAAA
ncbi:FAD-dependent monooxygenase [Mycolicibacterium palauense]|uniref:FAD-dependent monooxygenase n=1 Tax=Mycolicibacterium palauense TaxID=2034511 RepID=UPI001FE2D973|nr:FAD-dependent monooxygenase [Mycolicibacterium palauense]